MVAMRVDVLENGLRCLPIVKHHMENLQNVKVFSVIGVTNLSSLNVKNIVIFSLVDDLF